MLAFLIACIQVVTGMLTAEFDTATIAPLGLVEATDFLAIVTILTTGFLTATFFLATGFFTTTAFFTGTTDLVTVVVFAVVLVAVVTVLASTKLGIKLERAKVATRRKDNVFCIGLYTD